MSLQQKLNLNLKLQQKMVLTPMLQQAIRLLQLTRMDLLSEVSIELEGNPVLEDADTIEAPAEVPGKESPAEAAAEADPLEEFKDKIDVESYFQDYVETNMKYRGIRREAPQDAPNSERYISAPESLGEHLAWQVNLGRMDEEEREIARIIIGNLREDGYLAVSVEEVAATTNLDVETVERVLAGIQLMDPTGVAARSLKECLRVQLSALGGEPNPVALDVVEHYLEILEWENPAGMAAKMSQPIDRVEEALELIRRLNPKPGLSFSTTANPAVVPDVLVIRDGDDYRVVVNDDGMPKLRISNRYRAMVVDPATGEASKETMDYLRERLQSALWFLKSIEERQRTIYKVARELVSFQRDFLDKGPSKMRPLILRDVAERIGVHESTVSRVVSNKYVETPRGIFPMKYFFNTGINTINGPSVSSMHVKNRIREAVGAEVPENPLSDRQLTNLLRREGVLLARRTVAKYREELHIPSSARRKKPRTS